MGWVDPGREGKTLVARNLFIEKPAAVAPMARALTEAAQWVGCETVAIERVQPTLLAQPLASELRALGALRPLLPVPGGVLPRVGSAGRGGGQAARVRRPHFGRRLRAVDPPSLALPHRCRAMGSIEETPGKPCDHAGSVMACAGRVSRTRSG